MANESSSTDLEGLLAGLLLNTTGNFTGWLLNATGELATLGLLPAVLATLPNASYVNDGGYPAPTSSVNPPAAWSWWDVSADWSWFWNTASGVVSEGLSIAWNATIAGIAFVSGLAKEVLRLALNLASQVASALEAVARTMLGALDAFLGWLESEVVSLLTEPVVQLDTSVTGSSPAYGAALTSAESGPGSSNSRRTTSDWSNASAPALRSAGEASSSLQSVISLVQPILSPLGSVPAFLLRCLLKIMGIGRHPSPGWSKYSGSFLWQALVTFASISAGGIVGTLDLNQSSNASAEGAVFVLEAFALVEGTALSILAAALSKSPAGIFVAVALGVVSFAASFALATIPVGSPSYFALAGLAFFFAVLSAAIDGFSTLMNLSPPILSAGACVAAFDGAALGVAYYYVQNQLG